MSGPPILAGDDAADDVSISSDAFVLRRIPPGRWYHETDRRPHSDNFANSTNGTGTSVDIVEGDFSIEKAIDALPKGFGAVLLAVAAIRAAELGIVRARLPDNDFHATIQGKKRESRRKKLCHAAKEHWVKLPDIRT